MMLQVLSLLVAYLRQGFRIVDEIIIERML